MTDVNAIVEKMKAVSISINMYTFMVSIAATAHPKVKDVLVEEYLKAIVDDLCKDEPDAVKEEAVKELKNYFISKTEM